VHTPVDAVGSATAAAARSLDAATAHTEGPQPPRQRRRRRQASS
jgi:hypothetical protein